MTMTRRFLNLISSRGCLSPLGNLRVTQDGKINLFPPQQPRQTPPIHDIYEDAEEQNKESR